MSSRGINNELNGFELTTCKIQGDLFSDCQYLEQYSCDAIDFVTKYMNSDIAADMDKDVATCHVWGTKQLYETFMSNTSVNKFDNALVDSRALEWVGYLYRYWVWWLGDSSKDLINNYPVKSLLESYTGLHTLDPKESIYILKNGLEVL